MTARTHTIPDAALNQHIIALGKTGAGKSSALRVLVERMLDEARRLCIVDPKGDWYGLKLSASGKSAGYPVVIFGGDHADVPINPRSGSQIAELVATGNRPCIIDLGGWSVGDRTRFFIDFAAGLFRGNRSPLWLVIDEVHNFAPQGKIMDPDAGKMLHWANRLASEGRGKGITLMAASQRPQKTHKDFVTSMETLIAMRVIHPLDRQAIKDWIDGCPDREKGREVLETLASMARGEAWAWSPEIGFGPERIKFPKFKTYDSFAAPTGDAQTALKGWAEVDLDEVRTKLADVLKEAEANDPKILRKRLADLQAQLAAAQKAKAPAKDLSGAALERVAAQHDRHWKGQIDRLIAEGRKRDQSFARLLSNLRGSVGAVFPLWQKIDKELERAAFEVAQPPVPLVAVPPEVPLNQPAPVRPAAKPAPRVERPPSSNGDASHLTGPESRILAALAWCRSIGAGQPRRTLVAAAARYSPTSTGFTNPMGELRKAGLIEYPDSETLRLTPEGASAAPVVDTPPTLADFHQGLLRILSGPEERILAAVIRHGPGPIDRPALAEAARYSDTSTGFTNPLGALRSKGFVDYSNSGQVQATEALFPAGLE